MRFLSTIACLLITLVPAHAQTDQLWEFDVFLDDKQIGSHTFKVERDKGQTILQSKADFKVKFLFVTAFEYEHRNTEVWEDGCLAEIDATTNNNGEQLMVEGQRRAATFEVSGGKVGEQELDGCVRSFAYWQPQILDASQLLNAQTGEYETVSVTLDGEEIIQVAGTEYAAERYRLTVERGDLLLWYTKENQRWVALDAPAKGDRRIRYQASRIPADAPDVVAKLN